MGGEVLLLNMDLLKCESGSGQKSDGSGTAYSNNTRAMALTFNRDLRQQVCHAAFVMKIYHDTANVGPGRSDFSRLK